MEGRMRIWEAAAVLASVMVAGTAQAQTTYYWPAPKSPPVGEAKRYYIPMGTPLMLRTRTHISTKHNEPGDRVHLEVAENVSFRGQTVIQAGTPVIGEVALAQRNGHVGRKGKLEIRLLHVETPNGPVRLAGSAYDEGSSGAAVSVATMLLVSPLGGFFIHGTSAELPSGTPVKAHLAENLRFTWNPETAKLAALPARPDIYGNAASGSAD
ncbi:MAG: hypothetical protein J7499_14580 [Sphingopyxis sp.]|nr:hypothetical protein [Sphingopyxis sp.]